MLIVAAPRSGSGKTTLMLALLTALRRRGIAVRAAKTGPDFIDPAFHAAAAGASGPNLDSWAMPPALLDDTLRGAAVGAELLLIESAMGLFDGIEGPAGRRGSAADLARRGIPVLLLLDVSGQSQTAAAVARGFAGHDPAVRIAGVVLNRVASPRHHAGIAAALRELGMPLLGSMPRDPALALPERHLGLVQAREHDTLPGFLDRLGAMAEADLDLAGILRLAAPLPAGGSGTAAAAIAPPGQRIAVADDAAFSFLYPHLAAGWRRAGAELAPFSPLADEAPPEGCDCCWLPGGYPELHAGALAAATRFRNGLAAFGRTRPVHGECGGYMVLGEFLTDADGTPHRMAGLLGHATSFHRRSLHLGYREAVLRADCALGPAGTRVRGHEFHYARVVEAGGDAPLVDLADAAGNALGAAGGVRGLVSGSFFHAIAALPSATPREGS